MPPKKTNTPQKRQQSPARGSPANKQVEATPDSPAPDNVDSQVDELQALVRQSREEQAVISSKILALKSGGLTSASPGLRAPGFGTSAASSEEVNALREQLAETDALLLEKDAEVERLRGQLNALMVQVKEPKTAASWRQRYEDAQRRLEAREMEHNGLSIDFGRKKREIYGLRTYLSSLEGDRGQNNQQRDRLMEEARDAREKLRVNKLERDTLGKQLREFEEGFLRCISRITQCLAAGVVTVVIGEREATPRFVVLRLLSDRMQAGDEGVLEIFDEPHAYDELLSVDLSPAAGAKVIGDKRAWSILISSNGGNKVRLCCIGQDEYTKWRGALELVGHRA